MAEHDSTKGAGEKPDGVRRERRRNAGQAIGSGREEDVTEDQGGCRGIYVEVVPLDGCTDEGCKSRLAGLHDLLLSVHYFSSVVEVLDNRWL